MITVPKIRTSKYIRTMRMALSFRSCINATGKSSLFTDLGRVYLEECKRLDRSQYAKNKGSLS